MRFGLECMGVALTICMASLAGCSSAHDDRLIADEQKKIRLAMVEAGIEVYRGDAP